MANPLSTVIPYGIENPETQHWHESEQILMPISEPDLYPPSTELHGNVHHGAEGNIARLDHRDVDAVYPQLYSEPDVMDFDAGQVHSAPNNEVTLFAEPVSIYPRMLPAAGFNQFQNNDAVMMDDGWGPPNTQWAQSLDVGENQPYSDATTDIGRLTSPAMPNPFLLNHPTSESPGQTSTPWQQEIDPVDPSVAAVTMSAMTSPYDANAFTASDPVDPFEISQLTLPARPYVVNAPEGRKSPTRSCTVPNLQTSPPAHWQLQRTRRNNTWDGSRPPEFKCSWVYEDGRACGYVATGTDQQSNLRKHRTRQHIVQSSICPFCNRNIKRKDNMVVHVRRNHKDHPGYEDWESSRNEREDSFQLNRESPDGSSS